MEYYRVRGKTDRLFSRSQSYSLDQLASLAGRNQRTVQDGRGGTHIRRASRLMVVDRTGRHPAVVFVRDYNRERQEEENNRETV